jgi:quercetin 2,3-dioxygenase
VLASGFEDDQALPIRADARVLGATLAKGGVLTHDVAEGRHAYLVPATGAVSVDGVLVNARDGVTLGEGAHRIEASEEAELVLVDVV